MRKLLLLLSLIPITVGAFTTPDLVVNGEIDNSLLYGYRIGVYTREGRMVFGDRDGFFKSNDYIICLTPVQYGINPDGTHIEGGGMQCYYVGSPK